jgi:TrpR-related protein YerC/YecD
MKNWNNPKTEDLFRAIIALKNIDEAKRFFRDLLTEQEILEFGQRWQAAQMLDRGVSYSEIEGKTGLSSTTVARVSRWLNKGMGGYKLILKRLNHHSRLSFGKRSS